MSAIQNIQESLKGLSVEELLIVIAAAAAEAKKVAKAAPKVKEAKEKKGSMPKGVVPPQLHKPRAWVDFVLADANARGWPAITVKGQAESLPASVERNGTFVFESTGKPLNNKQAMSLSKQYWDRKASTGSHPKLYEVFEGQYVAPEPAAPKEAEEKVEEVKEAPKPKKAAKSEEEKAAEKRQKEAEKQAKKEAAKAEKEAAKPKKEAKKEAAKPVEEAPKEEPKPKKVVKKVVKKEEEEVPFECEDDGQCREWVLKGKKVYRDFEGHMWERTEEGEAGPWMGKYDAATKTLDASAEEPVCEDE